ncbi:class I SAM-dependent methyltransferase [Paenibacillus sp. FSL L8-0696]|uniref:class I SAM-dependent methyltransferase n=1 Tax=Paenibacillus sp. FSL L8-0696 TaxID=2954524 RepID=UPI00311947C6
MVKKNNCPVCESTKLKSILTRENIPVFQNLLINSQEDAKQIVKGDLTLLQCIDCGFVYNSSFDSDKVVYGSDYENTQSYSLYFDTYLNDLTSNLVNKNGVRNLNVVEVGCGKGVFLKKIVEAGNNYGYGFDPSYIGPEVELDGKLSFEKRLYNEECVHIKADVVICRHVIEHVSEPLVLLKAIRKALTHSPNARVFFETPCVEWILNNKVMFDFFYEHCSYFNKTSLAKAFELAGFEVVNIEHIFNDQYMWLEARSVETSGILDHFTSQVDIEINSNIQFSQYERQWKQKVQGHLAHYSKKGEIAIWGAGAKGVTFLNLIDPELKYINCVIDVNPNKVGKYLPGTGHEIVGVNALQDKALSTVIVMNPNYLEEIIGIIKQEQKNIDLISIEALFI